MLDTVSQVGEKIALLWESCDTQEFLKRAFLEELEFDYVNEALSQRDMPQEMAFFLRDPIFFAEREPMSILLLRTISLQHITKNVNKVLDPLDKIYGECLCIFIGAADKELLFARNVQGAADRKRVKTLAIDRKAPGFLVGRFFAGLANTHTRKDSPLEVINSVDDLFDDVVGQALSQDEQASHRSGHLWLVRHLDHQLLDAQEEARLLERLTRFRDANGGSICCDAGTELILKNLRLVWNITKKCARPGEDKFLDCFQEGILGLRRALEKYDRTRETRLSTYATYWIRQRIERYKVNHIRAVRYPVYVWERIRSIKKHQGAYFVEHGEWPTIEWLSNQVGLDSNDIEWCLQWSAPIMSLNSTAEYGREGDGSTDGIDRIIDANAPTHAELIEAEYQNGLVTELIGAVEGARNRLILCLRYGLADGECRTLKEVGARVGLTRERVRQIEAKAIKKMRRRASLLGLTLT